MAIEKEIRFVHQVDYQEMSAYKYISLQPLVLQQRYTTTQYIRSLISELVFMIRRTYTPETQKNQSYQTYSSSCPDSDVLFLKPTSYLMYSIINSAYNHQSPQMNPPRPHSAASRSKPFPDYHSDTSTEGEDPERYNEMPSDCFLTPTRQPSCKAKSSLCKNFTEKGLCPYGRKCQFAHGPDELRINSDLNRSYKTKECHSFAKKGYCCYGARCNFIHQVVSEVSKEDIWRQIRRNHGETLRVAKAQEWSRLIPLLGLGL